MHSKPLGEARAARAGAAWKIDAAKNCVLIAQVRTSLDEERGDLATIVVQNTRAARADGGDATSTEALGPGAETAKQTVLQSGTSLVDSAVAWVRTSLEEGLLRIASAGVHGGGEDATDSLLEVSWDTARCCIRRRGAQVPDEENGRHSD